MESQSTNLTAASEEKIEKEKIEYQLDLSNIEVFGLLSAIDVLSLPNGHLAAICSVQERFLDGRDWDAEKAGRIVQAPHETKSWSFTVPELRAIEKMAAGAERLEFNNGLALRMHRLSKRVEKMLAKN